MGRTEYLVKLGQQCVDGCSALLKVDQQVAGSWQEDVVHVGDDHDSEFRGRRGGVDEVQPIVKRDKRDSGAPVRVGEGVQRIGNRAGNDGDHAVLPRLGPHIDEKDVADGLGRADGVLPGRKVIDDAMLELVSLPAIGGPLGRLVPVEEPGDFVDDVAHDALPSRAAVDEGDKGVDVGAAAAAARDDAVLGDRDGWFGGRDGAEGGEDECEREFRFPEEGVGGWYGGEGAPGVRRVGVARR